VVKHAVCFRASVALVLPRKYLNYSIFAYLKAHMSVSQSLFSFNIRFSYWSNAESTMDSFKLNMWWCILEYQVNPTCLIQFLLSANNLLKEILVETGNLKKIKDIKSRNTRKRRMVRCLFIIVLIDIRAFPRQFNFIYKKITAKNCLGHLYVNSDAILVLWSLFDFRRDPKVDAKGQRTPRQRLERVVRGRPRAMDSLR